MDNIWCISCNKNLNNFLYYFCTCDNFKINFCRISPKIAKYGTGPGIYTGPHKWQQDEGGGQKRVLETLFFSQSKWSKYGKRKFIWPKVQVSLNGNYKLVAKD